MKTTIQTEHLRADFRPTVTSALGTARIALVHYWFVNRRGGERVVETIAGMFPQADLFALVVDSDTLPDSLRKRPIRTSFLQKLPAKNRLHRHLLPLYPMALEQFDLRNYDLVLSSESGPAKGVLTSSQTCHFCYCHSPMRYLWDFYHQYKNDYGFGLVARPAFALAAHYLRLWDSASADRVDYFVANSRNVANRIRKHYRRDATVVHPPVNVASGYVSDKPEDYYLAVGQFVDYKRMDLAVAACNRLGRRLHIVGGGEQYKNLKRLAGPSVHFCGSLSDEELREQYAHCRALLFPGEEDFGIVPVEALSFGRPVIAYGRGGILESVNGCYVDAPFDPACATGLFFRQQSVDSLTEAILRFEQVEREFHPLYIRERAKRFGPSHFRENFENVLVEKWGEFQRDSAGF